MKNIIVPVDFSETSLNAARYATKLLTGHYGVNMILHHVYNDVKDADKMSRKLEELKEDLREVGIVKMEVLAEPGSDFIEELEKLARHREADLVIMGITGRSPLSQSLVGSNTLKMVNTKVCPVLIIPGDAVYHDVKNVMLASDFKDTYASIPSEPIRKVLKTFQPRLHIVNIDSSHYVSLTEEYQAEKEKLRQMFKDLYPEFYFLGMNNVTEAINQFATDKKIDFIIIIHKEQSLFSKFFVKSHTKKLAYQGNIPVLAIHE
ncbi:MAG: universal stress protein [Chitinophagaceae bacterium]|nr:universal stress protein [Chitinophagaceae bacterium]